jgi:chemotaxis protein methyltransferase CheR
MPPLPISPQVLSILRSVIAEKTGLYFAASDVDLFVDKVSTRAMDAGFESLLDYYYFLRYDPAGPAEMDELTDSLVVNETYLFRELDQLEVMVSEFVLPMVREGRRPRIWSAACATGEEPHTIAMLLAHHGALPQVDIVASDISKKALARARTGDFSRRAVRRDLPAFSQGWVERQDDRVAVSAKLRANIDWRRINLIDTEAIVALGRFQVIMCRNVLIYFDDETMRRVVDNLTAVLTPGGALFVGVSESLLRLGTSLECQEHKGVFVYRKAP